MEQLLTALERIGNLRKERPSKSVLSPTSPHGLISADGKQSTSALTRTQQQVPMVHHHAANGTLKPTASLPITILVEDQNGQKQLIMTLSQVCRLQHQYGKTEAELKTIVDGFVTFLGHYPFAVIMQALKKFVLTHRDIPAPSDIEAIINPPEPRPDMAVFLSLQKQSRDGAYLTPDERDYMRKCERYALRHHADQTREYEDAKRIRFEVGID